MTAETLTMTFEAAPYQAHSATSRASAAAVDGGSKKDTDRAAILLLLAHTGPLTDEQIQTATGIEGNTERPRRRELQQAGLVRNSGHTAKTASGRNAFLWEVPR